MKKLITLFIVLSLGSSFFSPLISQDKEQKSKGTYIDKKQLERAKAIADKIDWSGEEVELVPVSVKNEFIEEVKVKLDTDREYTIGPNESLIIGKRTPGKYTLTVYNKNGEFVDNPTKNISKLDKFVLSKDTISNSGKITGITISEKVAVANEVTNLVPSQSQTIPQVAPQQSPIVQPTPSVTTTPAEAGKSLKFLNTRFSQLKLIVEGVDGKLLENNWIFSKTNVSDKPLPLILNGEKVLITPNHRIVLQTSNGLILQRYGFELDIDPADENYIWVVK